MSLVDKLWRWRGPDFRLFFLLRAAAGFPLSAGFRRSNPEFSAMPKWVKTIIAILLLPACIGAAQALWQVLRANGNMDTIWVAMGSGAACWVVIYLMLPKPMWIYVFGHELTHVLWAWLFGGDVKKFKVTSAGGHVVVTKTNFVIALAPYFFPPSTSCWWWRSLCRGASPLGLARLPGVVPPAASAQPTAFHVTLTWYVLQTRQTDITGQGYLFSAVVIFLGNVTVLLCGLPLLTGRPELTRAIGWWLGSTGAVWTRLGTLF